MVRVLRPLGPEGTVFGPELGNYSLVDIDVLRQPLVFNLFGSFYFKITSMTSSCVVPVTGFWECRS